VSGFLICFHVQANAGYAIEPLEIAFYEAILQIVGDEKKIHLGYRNYRKGEPKWLKEKSVHLVELSYNDMNKQQLDSLSEYLRANRIEHILAFDLSPEAKITRAFRKGGAKNIFSYYGAPMSPINHGFKLLLKRLQIKLMPHKPDYFIFESYGMEKTATHGRGISPDSTSVVRLGIDVDRFSGHSDKATVYNAFGIPRHRKIIFYAGHMEKRKGVDVIVKAAATLVNERNRNDLHFLICGNRNNEETMFDRLYTGTQAEDYITFGGYRSDIPELMAGCYAAVIASTGWDSFPRSSLEMAAAGLPLIVSDLAGLNETIENMETGLLFATGDHLDLADKIEFLADNIDTRNLYSTKGIDRVKKYFTIDIQRDNLIKTLRDRIR